MANNVTIFTFKEGLLSRIAHDLRLHVEPVGVTIARDGAEVRAVLDPAQIVVDGAVDGEGRLDPNALGSRDRAKIRENMRDEVLLTRRYPRIEFTGAVVEDSAERLTIRGELELAGVRRPLSFTARHTAGRVHARVTLRPSEFGIQPYKALAGAIRLQDRVIIDLDLDLDLQGLVD